MPHNKVIEEYAVVQAVEPDALLAEVDQFRETSPFKVGSEMPLQFISLPAILPSSCNVYTNSRKVFVKAIRKDIHTKIPASQNGLYVTAQHLGIASRNINTILQVGKTTCKVGPTIHILYLIKEEYRLPAIHAVIGLNYEFEVCSSHPLQTLVVEVYINNVLQKLSFCQ